MSTKASNQPDGPHCKNFVADLEVRMRERVLDRDALVGVEGQELVEQVDQLGARRPRQQLVPRHLGALGQRPQEVPRLSKVIIA